MNIKIEFKNKYYTDSNFHWIDPAKLQKYTLPLSNQCPVRS